MKLQLRRWTFAFALALGALLAFREVRRGQTPPPGPESGYYGGRTADGKLLFFKLKVQKSKAKSSLHLETAPDDYDLEGTRADDGRFTLKTPAFYTITTDTVTNLTGRVRADHVFEGDFVRGKRSFPFTSEYVAKLGHFARKRSLNVAGRGGGKEFEATWPEFVGDATLHRVVASRLSAEARGETEKFAAGAMGNIWEGLKDGGMSWSYDGTLDTQIIWLSPDVVSLLQLRYEYSGGAHGMTNIIGRNFWLQGGKVKELKLADLFAAGKPWLKLLNAEVIAKLRAKKAAYVISGEVKSFKESELSSFTVDASGLTIYFDPYAVDCYAAGSFTALVPWRNLATVLAPEGPTKSVKWP